MGRKSTPLESIALLIPDNHYHRKSISKADKVITDAKFLNLLLKAIKDKFT